MYNFNVCGGGEIGRRAGLRSLWVTPYEFKSRPPHHEKHETALCRFVFHIRDLNSIRASVNKICLWHIFSERASGFAAKQADCVAIRASLVLRTMKNTKRLYVVSCFYFRDLNSIRASVNKICLWHIFSERASGFAAKQADCVAIRASLVLRTIKTRNGFMSFRVFILSNFPYRKCNRLIEKYISCNKTPI